MIAIGARTSLPSPTAIARGMNPSSVHSVVIEIGRRRDSAACAIAAIFSTPSSRNWFTRSISTIAFLTTMPASMIRPMKTTTLSGVNVILSASTAPTSASGIENMITNGCSSDSNCEAITR